MINKIVDYVKQNIKSVKKDYPNTDKNILKSCLVYQYLAIQYLHELKSIKKILEETNQELGLIGYAETRSSRIMNSCLKWINCLRSHAILHDAFGMFYENYKLSNGYCYTLNNCPTWMRESPFCGQISGILYCFGKQINI